MGTKADSSRSVSEDPHRIMRIARSYYLDERSKVEIARSEGLSRWQVARILDDARAQGLVRITVGDPAEVNESLGARVSNSLGLQSTLVVGRSEHLDMPPSIESVGSALAEYLSQNVRKGSTIGLTWSRATEAMAREISRFRVARCDVVQLAGALTFTGDRLGSVEIIRMVARAAGGMAHPMYAPLIVDSDETRSNLEKQPEIQACLKHASHLDLAVVSIGVWNHGGSALHALLPEDLKETVSKAGAIGEISGRVFDNKGQVIKTELDNRVLGISSRQLRETPHVVATSYGAERAEATSAAARAGIFHTLIIDEPLARRILEIAEK